MHLKLLLAAGCCAAASATLAAEATVTLQAANPDGPGTTLGTVKMVETPYGLAFYPTLQGLPPGLHGFHVHEKAFMLVTIPLAISLF